MPAPTRALLLIASFAMLPGAALAEPARTLAARPGVPSAGAPIFAPWCAPELERDHQEALAKVLGRLRWPALARGVARVGHAMTDTQVDEALAFLGQAR